MTAAPGELSGPGAAEAIVIRGLRLWAHVGVLEQERAFGQWFELDLWLRWDLGRAACDDDLAASLDYGLAVGALQRQARALVCETLEHYSERIFDLLEELYGAVPMALELRKCRAPLPAFDGSVAVCRQRRWS
ncbi:MAG: dihydroneopterin aldolase [Prochlorococcaceae cyanobacterium]